MDKKQVQETYRETTPEEEQEYFEEVENELQCDLQTTQESICLLYSSPSPRDAS